MFLLLFTNLEVTQEQLWLVALNLSVLHWGSTEHLIKFDCFIGGNALLILRWCTAQPEVDRTSQWTEIINHQNGKKLVQLMYVGSSENGMQCIESWYLFEAVVQSRI